MAKVGFDLLRAISTIELRWKAEGALREEWDAYAKMYRGEYWNADTPQNMSRVSANYLFSNVQQILPLMTDNRPVWHVVARQAVFQPLMNVWSKALRYLWAKLDMDMKAPAAYRDALISETGCFQVDWDPETEDVRVDVVDPRHLVFPAGYDELEDCPWVCKRRDYTLAWVRRTYPRAADQVVAKAAQQGDDQQQRGGGADRDAFDAQNQWVTVYDLWMRDDDAVEAEIEGAQEAEEGARTRTRRKRKYPNGRFITFTASGVHGEPVVLSDFPSPYEHGRPPYVMLYDYRRPHEIWGMGEARQIRTLVAELNKTLQSMAFKVANQSKVNYEVDPSVVDDKKVESTFHRGGQFYVRRAALDEQSRPGIMLAPVAGPLGSEFNLVSLLIRMIEEISGVTEISKGLSEKKAEQTAQEVATLIETAYTRTRQRVRNFEDGIRRLLYLILSIMMQMYREPRTFSVRHEMAVETGTISNSRADAQRITADAHPVDADDPHSRAAQDRALEELIAHMPGDTDLVLVRFDIEVQTASTLPLDRQSLANLALRLLQMGAIDGRAALEILNFPDADRISARMERAAAAAHGGAAPQMEAHDV